MCGQKKERWPPGRGGHLSPHAAVCLVLKIERILLLAGRQGSMSVPADAIAWQKGAITAGRVTEPMPTGNHFDNPMLRDMRRGKVLAKYYPPDDGIPSGENRRQLSKQPGFRQENLDHPFEQPMPAVVICHDHAPGSHSIFRELLDVSLPLLAVTDYYGERPDAGYGLTIHCHYDCPPPPMPPADGHGFEIWVDVKPRQPPVKHPGGDPSCGLPVPLGKLGRETIMKALSTEVFIQSTVVLKCPLHWQR